MVLFPPSLPDDLLLRIELDDQLLLDRKLDVLALGELHDDPRERLRREIEPPWNATGAGGLDRGLDLFVDPALCLDRHDLTFAHPVRRDRDLAAVDRDVAVAHELTRLRPRRRKPQGIDDVVQAPLELLEEVRSRDSLAALGAREGEPELPLEKAVDALDLLLLAKLNAVAQELRAPAAMLPRRVIAPLDGAFVLEAAVPLQEQLHPLDRKSTRLNS